jgi:hypothetical protein
MSSERCGGKVHTVKRKKPENNMIFPHELIREVLEGFCIVNSEPTHFVGNRSIKLKYVLFFSNTIAISHCHWHALSSNFEVVE